MNIKELITELQKYNEDKEVLILGYSIYNGEVDYTNGVNIKEVRIGKEWECYCSKDKEAIIISH